MQVTLYRLIVCIYILRDTHYNFIYNVYLHLHIYVTIRENKGHEFERKQGEGVWMGGHRS